jgi:hypothetical protein
VNRPGAERSEAARKKFLPGIQTVVALRKLYTIVAFAQVFTLRGLYFVNAVRRDPRLLPSIDANPA